jgi:hypothetical protein
MLTSPTPRLHIWVPRVFIFFFSESIIYAPFLSCSNLILFSTHTRTTSGNDMHAHTTLSTIVSYRNETMHIVDNPQLYYCLRPISIARCSLPTMHIVDNPQLYYCLRPISIARWRLPTMHIVDNPQLYYCLRPISIARGSFPTMHIVDTQQLYYCLRHVHGW